MKTGFGFSCVLILSAVLAGDPAIAQTSDALQEIVVTAEKRASTVQDTPISMTAVSGELMRQQGIANLNDVILAVPGLSMRTSGPGQTELEMRGLSSSGGASPTVGFYLDDFPVTSPAASLVVKLVTNSPEFDKLEGSIDGFGSGTVGGGFNRGVNVMLNVPIIDDAFAMRV